MSATTDEAKKPAVTVDDELAADPTGRIWKFYAGGVTAMALEVGHRTGLVRVAAARGDEWATPAELAAAAGCQERLTREWLSCMACARLFEHEPAAEAGAGPGEQHGRFRASAGLRKALDRDGHSTLVWSQMLSAYASVMDRTVAAFQQGGGVPHEHHGALYSILDESHREAKAFEKVMLAWLDTAPQVATRLRAGEPLEVLEIGCGGGYGLCVIARNFPRARFVGCDQHQGSVDKARALAAEMGLGNVRFDCRELGEYAVRQEAFDLCLACDVVHDLARPAEVLRKVRACLRSPGGLLLVQDIPGRSRLADNKFTDANAMWYGISVFHCLSASLSEPGSAALGTMWGTERALEVLGEGGFAATHVESGPDGTACYVCVPVAQAAGGDEAA